MASRLAFALPRSGREGPRGVMATAPASRLPEWEQRGAAWLSSAAAGTEDWEPESPGWRALSRFGGLVEDWPDREALASVGALAAVSPADFQFVDNLYWLTHCLAPPAGSPMTVTCANCGATFQPLAPTPRWSAVGNPTATT